jgi:phosphodiesterase/alkaline phosphatase D-like protein
MLVAYPFYGRAPAVLVAGLALALLTASPASAGIQSFGFKYGVAAGEVKSTSAILWTRSNSPGPITLQVSTNRQFAGPLAVDRTVTAKSEKDNTVQPFVDKLKDGTTYFYRFRQASATSAAGRFATAPKATADETIRFGFSGDADAQRKAGQQNPFWNQVPGNNGLGAQSFGVYRRMTLEKNDFNVNMGDTIYSDSEVPGQGALASTLQQKWAKYRLNLALPKLQALRASTGMYNHWDDHEFVADYTRAENGNAIYLSGKTAFLDYMPAHFTQHGGLGLYNHERWGKNLEVFRLDERSFRSAKASANHTCDNPSTGSPDFAPTLPQSRRDALAPVIPSFSQPVSQACKDKIDDPKRTMLGSPQFNKFTSDIENSTATFKVILNEVPIQQIYALPYDRWEGYEAERRRLLHTLANHGVKNTVFITTDLHSNLLNVVRYQTLESGGPKNSPYSELVTGPVSTKTFKHVVDKATGTNGAGNAMDAAFFGPQPPNGLGMPCSNVDIYSYIEASVGAKSLILTAKDVNGNVVKDQSDGTTQCRLVLNKQ